MSKVLLISASDISQMTALLDRAGYSVVTARSIDAAVRAAKGLPHGSVIVVAANVPGGGAVELCKKLREREYTFPVLAIVDNLNNGSLLREMMRGGNRVTDIIQRPAMDKELVELVNRYSAPHGRLESGHTNVTMPEESKTWKALEGKIGTIATTNANVIIFGESGTGKEQIAMAILKRSHRSDKPHKVLEAGGAALVESVVPVAEHSDIYNRISSYFKSVAGGTLIVKNIEFLSLDKQSVLLHILKEENPDVRLICTADPYLLRMVSERGFRNNLFYMLREVEISVPALREIPDELEIIAEDIINKDAEIHCWKPKKLAASAVKELKKLCWPGNLRELKNVLLLAVRSSKGDKITKDDLYLDIHEPEESESGKLYCPVKQKRRIEQALQVHNGNKKATADSLGISRGTLDKHIRLYEIDVEAYMKRTSSKKTGKRSESASDSDSLKNE